MDTLAEWLRRRPAKPMGSTRAGSNPAGVAFAHSLCCDVSPHSPPTSSKAFWLLHPGFRVTAQKYEARAIRTPNLLIWSQTRYHCAIAPLGCNAVHWQHCL